VLFTVNGGRQWRRAPSGIKDHLYAVVAAPEGWWAVGDKGWVLAGDSAGTQWQARRLGDRELAWHTDLAAGPSGIYLAGANVGFWDGTAWRTF
jgi:hypothetical protein